MNKKLLICSLLCLICSCVNAQIRISGFVTAKENGQGIGGVAVVTNSAQQLALTDSIGHYSISAYPGDTLCFSFFGIETKRVVSNTNESMNVSLPIDVQLLDGVTISEKRVPIQVLPDKFIVTLDSTISLKGKETSDLIKQLPMISVSTASLNIMGKDNTIVYLNNRIIHLSGAALTGYLNSISVDDITSIEIVPLPPSEYDASGNVGIIKITTKKSHRPGLKGFVKGGFMQNSYSSGQASAYINYAGEKSFFECTVLFMDYLQKCSDNYEVHFTNETMVTNNVRKLQNLYADANLTFGYDFSEKTQWVISMQLPGFNLDKGVDLKNHTDFFSTSNVVDSSMNTQGSYSKNTYAFNLESFFRHNFGQQSSFTFSVSYLDDFSKNMRDWKTSKNVPGTHYWDDNCYTTGDFYYSILTPQVDFSFPVLHCQAKAGYKLSYISTKSSSDFFNLQDEVEIMDSLLSNSFNYKELVNALYFNVSKNWSKWALKVGIRGEYTLVYTSQSSNTKQYNKNYFNLFPSFFASYYPANSHRLTFSYARRIQRPPFSYLDPFRYYISKYNYTEGNPTLRPSFRHNVEMTYIYKNNLSCKVYYNFGNDVFGQYVILDSNNINLQVQKTDNFFKEHSLGFGLYYYVNKKWFESTISGEFAYVKDISKSNQLSDCQGIMSVLSMQNNFQLGKNFVLICNLSEYFPGLYNHRFKGNAFELDIGLVYSIFKASIDIKLIAFDIFNTATPAYFYYSNGIKQNYRNNYDTRCLKFVFSWKIGNWYNNKTNCFDSPGNAEKQRL